MHARTDPVAEDENRGEGRWSGRAKTESGIHALPSGTFTELLND
jgi:hypothetical protein